MSHTEVGSYDEINLILDEIDTIYEPEYPTDYKRHNINTNKGLITFNIDGNIIISKKIETSQFKLLNISESINLRVEQIPYIKWHKEKVFNKISKV